MFEIDTVPQEIYAFLADETIPKDEILLAAKCDKTREHLPSDVYLFATRETLFLVAGIFTVSTEKGHSERTWKLSEFTSYPLKNLSDFQVEELISSSRFTAKNEKKEPIFICAMSNFCRTSMILFKKYLIQLQKTGKVEMDPDDDPKASRCPKCGSRYPDKNRKVCPKCMEKGKLFTRMAKFFLRYKKALILSLVSLIVVTGFSVASTWISSGFFIENVLTDTANPLYGAVVQVIMMLIAVKLVSTFAMMIHNYVTSVIAAKVNLDLKKTIFNAIEKLSLGFFTGRQTGGLMTQVNDDSNTIYDFFCNVMPYFFINAAKVIVLTVLLILINPALTGLSFLVIPLSAMVIRFRYQRIMKYNAKRYSARRAMNSLLSDELSGIRVVKAFAKEKEEEKRFHARSKRFMDIDIKRAAFVAFILPVSGFLTHVIGNLIPLGVGGWMVIQGSLSYADLVTFIAYVAIVYGPLQFFIGMSDYTADCSNAMQRLFEILDARPEVTEAEHPIRMEHCNGDIRFENVTFSYVKNHKAIDNVSFTVKAGETLGIVGHTGAGKSTLANLLIRLYDPESGKVEIDGVDIKKLAFADLYSNIAIVSQETYLFMGTVLDNIRYAKKDASYDEVVAAAKIAGAHDFIVKLPEGYETKIGFGFKDLSGGERQRLSIARAVLRNPKILILDEATSAMDTETERKIQSAITELVKDKTTIMIAHRLSTLHDADKLIVIENGKVVESGTHKELYEKEGVYHTLYTLQLEALKNAGIAE